MRKLERLLLVLLLLGELCPAWAANPRQQADGIFRRGRRLYSQGRYEPALKLFQRAQRLYPSYKIELSIAYALEALDRPAEAAHFLELSLAHAPDQASASLIASASQRLLEIQRQVASVSVAGAPPGATVVIGGKRRGQTPLPQRIYLPPGSYTLSVENPDGEQLVTRRIDLRQGQHYLLEVPALAAGAGSTSEQRGLLQPELEDSSQQPEVVIRARLAEEPAEAPFYKTWWFWTAGAVVVGAAVGVVLATQLGDDGRLPQGSMGTIYLDR